MRAAVATLLISSWLVSSGAGCSSPAKCEDAALVQLHFNQPADNCRVNIFPAGADAGTLATIPSYQFPSSPGGTGNCPILEVVPPAAPTVACQALQGPTPTSCAVSAGCFTLTFWGDAGTALRTAIGSKEFDAFLFCNGVIVDQSKFDPAAPANEVYCRDVAGGGVSR